FTSALFFWAVFAAIFALRANARAAQIATKHLQNFNAPVFELNQLSTRQSTGIASWVLKSPLWVKLCLNLPFGLDMSNAFVQ
ncbi:MAG: hypothetical protein IKS20_09130, partial [Victivallales bacterium]|nr:hypothetical protein [Victivallales bacterium]